MQNIAAIFHIVQNKVYNYNDYEDCSIALYTAIVTQSETIHK